jgi:Ser/Thr protein kinase RdoA (MazF antagonist)
MGKWQIVRGAAPPEAMRFIRQHARMSTSGDVTILRQGHTRVTFLASGLGVIKVLRRVSLRTAFRSLLRPSTLTREWDLLKTAMDRGIPVSKPVFSAERRVAGLLREAAIMVEIVDGASSLQQILEDRFPTLGGSRQSRRDTRRVLARYGSTLAKLHKAGGIHGDTSPDNALVRDDPPRRLFLIDWASSACLAEARKGPRRSGRAAHSTTFGRRRSRNSGYVMPERP